MLRILYLLLILSVSNSTATESETEIPVTAVVKDEALSQKVFDLVKVISKYASVEREAEINEAIKKLAELPKAAFEGIDPIEFDKNLFVFHNEESLDSKVGRLNKLLGNIFSSNVHMPDHVVLFLWKLFKHFSNEEINFANFRLITFFFFENSPSLLESSEKKDVIEWYRKLIVYGSNLDFLEIKNYNSFYNIISSLNINDSSFRTLLNRAGSWEMERICESSLLSEVNKQNFDRDGLKNLYNYIKIKCDQAFLANVKSQTSTQEITARLYSALPEMYKDHLKTFSQMIFSDIPQEKNEIKQQEKYSQSSYDVGKIIFNNDAYTVDDNGQTDIPVYMTRGMEKGSPLILEEYEYPKGTINKGVRGAMEQRTDLRNLIPTLYMGISVNFVIEI